MTQEIELIEFTESDFERLIGWIKNAEDLVQFSGPVFTFPLTFEQLKLYKSDDKRKAFKVKNILTEEIIGHSEIYLKENNVGTLCRILIGKKEYRNKGYGQKIVKLLLEKCFNEFNCVTTELNVFDWNKNAIRCYEKSGFEINYEKSFAREVNGTIWKTINMKIDKNKWLLLKINKK